MVELQCTFTHKQYIEQQIKQHDMIYLLTAIGLTPDGSTTVHIYTQTIHRTTN
jgi:hypothetical protein